MFIGRIGRLRREGLKLGSSRRGVGVGDGRVDMQRKIWLLLAVLLVVWIGVISSCSEDSVTDSRDGTFPQTEILYPISTADNRIDISDSIDVYITATDDQEVTRVELWTSPETESEATLLATLTEPLPDSAVPDSLKPADGRPVYGDRWYTRLIRNGTIVRVFSRAYDPEGNATRSDLVIVRILNEGGDLFPPDAQFTISPPAGTVEDLFMFDASLTTDQIDDPSQILVRWDFDGDGTWEYDFDDEIYATTEVTHDYTLPRVYDVILEARNTYLVNQVGRRQRSLEVTNVGGIPDPLEPQEMIRIPAGIYSVGTADTSSPFADEDEFPLHRTNLTNDFFIRRTEVPNRLYILFLAEKMAGEEPQVTIEGTDLVYYPDLVPPVEEDSLPRTIVDLGISRLFYDPDGDSIAIEPGDRNLPVVGVSWYGAKAYAENYGLRLPTEHEWEIAAKADSMNWIYPWGTTIMPDQANYNHPESPAMVLPIGSYPAAQSPFGLLDLSGNVKEWVKDWYADYPSGPQTNPEGPLSGNRRVIRGGSYQNTAAGVRVTAREAGDPTQRSPQIGFRTAYTATE
ncbi:MAG: SUMF1/EgtB/PvdO family nonheme iron enzyme [Candidatus Eisenbacteria bacterium]|nr:SUMF1/EgtB/PvdO family nonheme iron enzyme [Candidatus Latescibacterota bacterium]MBD3303440.1 SUMF1/EgtB/PvdO family nonheme iron enzyme [Candidatus Eisenbacteria bacterium]